MKFFFKISYIIGMVSKRKLLFLCCLTLISNLCFADDGYDRRCGAVDYTQHAEALAGMSTFVVTITLYVIGIAYVIASIFSMYSSVLIFFKMNNGEDGVTKEIMKLFHAILFLICATSVLPGFFGLVFI